MTSSRTTSASRRTYCSGSTRRYRTSILARSRARGRRSPKHGGSSKACHAHAATVTAREQAEAHYGPLCAQAHRAGDPDLLRDHPVVVYGAAAGTGRPGIADVLGGEPAG